MFKALEDENPRESQIEAVVMTHKPHTKRGRDAPFIISLEIGDLIIHNCMVAYGANHIIMPLSIMRTIDLDYTRHCKVRECIFSIDSRCVPMYREIKDFCAR